MKKSRKQTSKRAIPAWQIHLTLVFTVGMIVMVGADYFYRERTNAESSDGTALKARETKSGWNAKVRTPPKEERIRLATDRVLNNFGIRVEWIKYRGNNRDVRVPKEIHPLVIYHVLSNQVRQLGGKVESGREDLRTGVTILTYSFSGKTLGNIRLIPDPNLTRHSGKIAIILDDLGYSLGEVVTGFLNLQVPIAYSIIPGTQFAQEVAARVYHSGKLVLIHMPMEALEKKVANDGYSLMVGMPSLVIRERVQKAIRAVPYAEGMNNHMGSAATVNDSVLVPVFEEVKKAGLFFIDSRTNPNTRAFSLAKKMGLETDINDIFLDSEESWERVQSKMWQLADLAAARGAAIAIGHPHPNTLRAVREISPLLIQRGFEFVPVSELVGKQPAAGEVLAQRAQ